MDYRSILRIISLNLLFSLINKFVVATYFVTTPILIDKKIYAIGETLAKRFISIDVSTLSNFTSTLEYISLSRSEINSILNPRSAGWKDFIIIYGTKDYLEDPYILKYNVTSQALTKDVSVGPKFNALIEEPFIGPDDKGNIYIYNENNIFYIFNLETFKWDTKETKIDKIFPDKVLIMYKRYTATILPNGIIVFLGGVLSFKPVPMNKIILYDTINGSWSTIDVDGDFVGSRELHSACLTSDGRIIVYGGKLEFQSVEPDLAVLDTSVTPYKWTVPYVINPIGQIIQHITVMVDEFMVLYFGNNITTTGTTTSNQNIFMLDTRNKSVYTWYNMELVKKDGTNGKVKLTTIWIIFIVASSLVVSALIVFFVYKCCKIKHKNRSTTFLS
ncbi:18978_t:CDS:2 [Funneliformis geosporum]|nr:18978_t:CDS:2 [Funneliformis geosporum]